jgi:RimJ/RimL family protein N-acetyltransferase
MLLRQAAMRDLPALVAVQEAGARLALANIFPQDVYPFPRDEIQSRWATEIASSEVDVYVVERQPGRVEGFAATRANELLHFGTAVDTWGTGLAAAAHRELIELLAATQKQSAWLRVFDQNHRARRFYEKMGWQPTARRTQTRFPPHPTLIHYEIAL